MCFSAYIAYIAYFSAYITDSRSDIADPARSHKFWCDNMAQHASDSEIVAFPFPWAKSEFHFVVNCHLTVCRFCIVLHLENATQSDATYVAIITERLSFSNPIQFYL